MTNINTAAKIAEIQKEIDAAIAERDKTCAALDEAKASPEIDHWWIDQLELAIEAYNDRYAELVAKLDAVKAGTDTDDDTDEDTDDDIDGIDDTDDAEVRLLKSVKYDMREIALSAYASSDDLDEAEANPASTRERIDNIKDRIAKFTIKYLDCAKLAVTLADGKNLSIASTEKDIVNAMADIKKIHDALKKAVDNPNDQGSIDQLKDEFIASAVKYWQNAKKVAAAKFAKKRAKLA